MGVLRKLLFLLALLWIGCPAAQETYPFRVDFAPDGDSSAAISGYNEGPVPVTVLLKLDVADNAASAPPLPFAMIVPARTTFRLARVYRVDPKQAWTFKYSYRLRPGLLEAAPDPAALYRLPWLDGRSFRVEQAPGGPLTSHDTPETRDAIDFSMPEGTPVLAARGGIVFSTVASYSAGGKDKSLEDKANIVRVMHADGTIGNYVHLMRDGVAVAVGERVDAGKLLGFSGNTGYSSGPHLHFSVTRIVRAGEDLAEESLPVKFAVGEPPQPIAAQAGAALTANSISTPKSLETQAVLAQEQKARVLAQKEREPDKPLDEPKAHALKQLPPLAPLLAPPAPVAAERLLPGEGWWWLAAAGALGVVLVLRWNRRRR